MTNPEQEEARALYEDLAKREKQMMEKYGWVTHFVVDTDDNEAKVSTKTGVDIHTHGLEENFNHPDLQIALPIDASIAHSILTSIIDNIKEGNTYKDGDVCKGLLKGDYKVRFQKVNSDRSILRIILPNKEGQIMPSELEGAFYDQCL
jgi:hypothetical protein